MQLFPQLARSPAFSTQIAHQYTERHILLMLPFRIRADSHKPVTVEAATRLQCCDRANWIQTTVDSFQKYPHHRFDSLCSAMSSTNLPKQLYIWPKKKRKDRQGGLRWPLTLYITNASGPMRPIHKTKSNFTLMIIFSLHRLSHRTGAAHLQCAVGQCIFLWGQTLSFLLLALIFVNMPSAITT